MTSSPVVHSTCVHCKLRFYISICVCLSRISSKQDTGSGHPAANPHQALDTVGPIRADLTSDTGANLRREGHRKNIFLRFLRSLCFILYDDAVAYNT